jgi:SAM-dependent methyltransferase
VRLADQILEHVYLAQRQRAVARWQDGRGDRRTHRWPEAAEASKVRGIISACNICGWRGHGFEGRAHSESAICPICGSIARDRFLHWCWTERSAYDPRATVLETSPRLDAVYRERMSQRVDYLASDFDGESHRAAIQLDLQAIDLPDASVDVVLSAHVLEHVPDTDRALEELLRVLKPGGHAFLQVPLPQGVTGVPSTPEFHGDRTKVYFRFGWDLATRMRSHGFVVDTLVTAELRDAAADPPHGWVYDGGDCDVDDLMASADPATMTVVASARQAARYGFRPAFHFVTFDGRRPG